MVRGLVVITPALAGFSNTARNLKLLDVIRPNQEIREKTSAVVPGQMTMEWPDTRIVSEELDDRICLFCHSTSLRLGSIQDVYIASHGIAWVGDCAVPLAIALS